MIDLFKDSSLSAVIYDIDASFRVWLEENATVTSAKELGLDPRSGYQLWVTLEQGAVICLRASQGSLEYYGGFEYINKAFVDQVGSYMVYHCDYEESSCRVQDCIDAFRSVGA